MFKGRHRAILLMILTLLLSGCGGGGGGGASGNRELQLYQDAMAVYQTADYSGAVNFFAQSLAEFPTGTYSDECRYRLGRSHQALSQLAEARDAYAQVSPTGSWADAAAFYTARTYYDEAALPTTAPADAFAALDTAISRLNGVISAYPTSSLVDQTHYYLGRSYQEQAMLLKRDPTLSGTTTAMQGFADARTHYAAVQGISVFYDNALYFKGRTYHEQVPADYVNARQSYDLLRTDSTSSWADDAQYQYAKTFYDEAGDVLDPTSAAYDPATAAATALDTYNTAISEFDKLTASPNTLYPGSNRIDGARYYKGRSLHRQAALVAADATLDTVNTFDLYFANARTAYQSVIDLGTVSPYADNAQYRIGRTYYDEAVIALAASDYVTMQQELSDAIAALTVVTTDSLYQVSNSADNAYYYLGRSYQRGAEIPAANQIAVAGGVDFTQVSFADARSRFEVLTGTATTASAYPNSAWIDNAYYETGNTWMSQALLPGEDLVADYAAALNNYNKVLVDYKGVSSREDNAARKVASVYHDTGYCTDEVAAYNYVKTIATATAFSIAEADTHLSDLASAPTTTHPCSVSVTGLPGFTAP